VPLNDKNGFTFQQHIVKYKMPAMTNYNANTISYDRFLTKQLENYGARTHGDTKRKEERLLRFLEKNERVNVCTLFMGTMIRDISFDSTKNVYFHSEKRR
jgi:hypothetical protein